MTQEEFYPPFQRLALAYDRFAFLSNEERILLTEDWFECFQAYGGRLWARGVAEWKTGHPKFPTQSEMHDLLGRLAPVMVAERERAEVEAEIEARRLLSPDPRAAEVLERLRSFRRIIGAAPAPPARPQLEDHDVE